MTMNYAMETSVPTASTDGHSNGSMWFTPPLGDCVPERQIISRKINGDRPLLAWTEVDIREALQNGWGFSSRLWHVHIKLRNLKPNKTVSRATNKRLVKKKKKPTSVPGTEPVFLM